MRRHAFVDIAILALVFWGVWSLRFAGVENIGLWSILAAVGAGAVLLAIFLFSRLPEPPQILGRR